MPSPEPRSSEDKMPPLVPSANAPIDPVIARLHIWQIQAVRDVLFVGLIIGIVYAGYAMRAVTVPLLVALLLAYLFEPLVSHLTRRFQTSRPVVVSGLLVTVGAVTVLVLAITIPLVVSQTIRFVQDVRDGRFQHSILRMKEFVPQDFQANFEQMLLWIMPSDAPPYEDYDDEPEVKDAEGEPTDQTNSNESTETEPIVTDREFDEIRLRQIVREELSAQSAEETNEFGGAGSIVDLVRSGSRAVFGLIGTIVQLGLLAFLIPFYFFFFSVSFPTVTKFGRDLIPIAHRPQAMDMIAKMDRAVAGFVRGRIVICFIMGAMLAIGWLISGVPYSIVLGMVVGAFCLVPYLGGVGVPLAIALLAFHQMSLPEAERMAWWGVLLWPTLVFAIVQMLENYILTPVIAGKATNLDPVTILVAVLAGGSIGGVYGMILAIPVAACLKILWTEVMLPKVKAWTRGEANDPLPISKA